MALTLKETRNINSEQFSKKATYSGKKRCIVIHIKYPNIHCSKVHKRNHSLISSHHNKL